MKMNRTVRDFQNALESLLKTHQFGHLTIDQICNEALLHRSSFYRYFHDKYDLLEQTISTRLNILIDQSDRNEDEFVEILIKYVSDNRDIFHNLADSSSQSSLYGEIMKIVSEILLRQRHVTENQDTIVTALRNSKNPEMLAYILSGSILGAFYWWRQNNYEVPQQDVIDFVKQSMHNLSDQMERDGLN